MTTDTLNATEVATFAGSMIERLNGAAVVLMTSIGHQTGLFDTLAALPPATSQQIAAAAGLNERYVREWLGVMVTGGVVELDAERALYRLPPERAACLTRAAGPNNLASIMQFLPLLCTVESGVVESFRTGGGLPYSAYPRFHALMAEVSAQTNDAALLDVILPLVPGLPERLRAGITVADIGCGAGHALNLMARAFPASRFTGYDFSEQAIATARAEAAAWGLTNVEFVVCDVATLAAENAYDLVTAFDAIHDQAQPATVLRNIVTALKPDGVSLIVDIAASSNVADNRDHPLGPYLYTVSTMHCMTVSLALGGQGLGTVWGEQQAIAMLTDAGFTSIDVKRVEGDILNNYYVCARG